MAATSILGRHHYTVDIVLALIVNTLTFTAYQLLALIGESKVGSVGRYSRLVQLVGWADGVDLRRDAIADNPSPHFYSVV